MSKPETREQIKARKVVAAWQPQMESIAKAAAVKPAFVRLAGVRLEGGETEVQLCVSGRGDSDTKHNIKAITRAVKALTEATQAPVLPVKRCSHSCLLHYSDAPV